MEICCLTNFDELAAERRFGEHGIFYYMLVAALLAQCMRWSFYSETGKLALPTLCRNGRRMYEAFVEQPDDFHSFIPTQSKFRQRPIPSGAGGRELKIERKQAFAKVGKLRGKFPKNRPGATLEILPKRLS